MISNHLQVENLRLDLIKDYARQIRKPSKTQTAKTIRMLEACGGIVTPVIVDKENTVVVGAHLVVAARQTGLAEIPVIRLEHLDDAQIKILRIAYDRIAEEAQWDKALLAQEFLELEILVPEIDLTVTGFEVPEVDIIVGSAAPDLDHDIPPLRAGPAVTRAGDLYNLDGHRLLCGDALSAASYETLMAGEKAQMCFTDAPYNVKIAGHVGNSGKIKHPEFVQGVGEFDFNGFTDFLHMPHKLMATHSVDGAIIYSCMDWRHLQEILTAGMRAGLALQNICVWVKDNGGMGSLYRSRHEFVLVFKNGAASHINNISLGKYGRYRTNVWEYPGVNSFGGGRMGELAMHPTVKPLAMVMDAIKDCSKRGGIVLDPFGGSGTTLVAAEKTGRKTRLIELDPHYCDVTIRRWQELTGKDAVHSATGKTFNAIERAGGQNE